MHRKADLKKRWETFDGRQLRDCAILCPFSSHPKGTAAGMLRPWNDAPKQQAAVPAAIFRVPPLSPPRKKPICAPLNSAGCAGS